MSYFLLTLKHRNEVLFYYGLVCLAFALACLVATKTTQTQLYGVNAWYKPFKFAFSTFLLVWAIAWYVYHLPHFNTRLFSWSMVVLLGFEIGYIALQASKGQPSHYNNSTPLYALLFSLMALAATLATLYIAYVGLLFMWYDFPALPNHYVWAIRLGIWIFVVFAFEGFLMGGQMSHTVGLQNDNSSLWIVGWSRRAGDLRIAHFVGMHAIQCLPLLSYYVLKNTKLTLAAGLLYALLATFTLVQALQGRPLLPERQSTQQPL
ncbi:hypothetical protein [Eisenibacter elegans]|jgi:hypothetical protein|uniref:hypothetical protein n=1 Tax=Eisenibacter elegans TaxID=997 RepID=UPI0004208698|nr:hypothetical protein [Eisenibacter elegans]